MGNAAIPISVSLLGSALTAVGVTAHLAWDSLIGKSELQDTPPQPIAQSQPAILTPLASARTVESPRSISPPESIRPVIPAVMPAVIPAVSTASTTVPTTVSAIVSATIPASAAPTIPSQSPTWSRAENDYLYDLSRALQPVERHRLTQTEQVEIAHQIQQWMLTGADEQSLLQQFDAVYGSKIAGNYFYNRDIYLRYAMLYFAPELAPDFAPNYGSMPPIDQSVSDLPPAYPPAYPPVSVY